MPDIRPACAADVPMLTELLAELGYPSEPAAVTARLAGVLNSRTQQILVAARADDSRLDGYVGLDRRLTLHEDEHVEITDLVVNAAARRTGHGRALVTAAEEWAVRHGLHTVVVRSNVVREESHPFYERIGYQRTTTSHTYRKQVDSSASPGCSPAEPSST